VVEDCAQAQEATIDRRPVGAIGEVGCFSFYPTKNLGAIGDGGLIVSANPDLVDRLCRLRTYGWSKSQFAELPNGRCSRLDELQAAILNVKLDHLAADVERRRAIAFRYNAAFADLPLILPTEKPGCRHVYHLYVIRCNRRDDLAQHLDHAGIETAIHYPFAVHTQPGLAAGARIPQPLKVTDMIVREILSLPLYPSMSNHDQDRVIEGVRSFYTT
jgi:dTDP-4-amino-4,6-dideoxygalactose transaminase